MPDVGRGGTRLNTIFAQLPSYDNPDFLGMDAALNRLKGSVSRSIWYFKKPENTEVISNRQNLILHCMLRPYHLYSPWRLLTYLQFWNPGLTGAGSSNNANAYQQSLADLAVVMSIANDRSVSSLFENTNARIYQAFLGIDELITQSCSPILNAAGSPVQAIWAGAVSLLMCLGIHYY